MQYSRIDGLPGQFFTCDSYRATLSIKQCATNWQAARKGGERNFDCHRCPIGASHATWDNPGSTYFGASLCPRCRRNGLRLIGGELCVSCYNREREFLLGANGKGAVPVKIKALPERVIHYFNFDAGPGVLRRARTLDAHEPMFAVLRTTRAPVAFVFRSGVAHGR